VLELQRQYAGVSVLLGVDRVDYIKGSVTRGASEGDAPPLADAGE